MMKRRYSATPFLYVLSLLFLCGCPYESEFPLSTASEAKIDKKLVGEWKFDPKSEEGNPSTIIFCPFNDNEFVVVGWEKKKDEDDIGLMKAFVTTIGDAQFLNIMEIGPTSKGRKDKWLFAKYSVLDDTLTVNAVEETLFKKSPSSSNALNAFLKSNLKNKDLYKEDEELVLKRVAKTGPNKGMNADK